MSHLHAEQLTDLAALAGGYPQLREFLPTEIALALGVAESTAARYLDEATETLQRLPGTVAALHAGRITPVKAAAIRAHTQDPVPAVAARVEADVLRRAGRQTVPQLRDALARAVLRRDPDDARRRHEKAAGRRHVSMHPRPDGMAGLWAYGPAQDVSAIHECLTALGRAAPRAAMPAAPMPGVSTLEPMCARRSWTPAVGRAPRCPNAAGHAHTFRSPFRSPRCSAPTSTCDLAGYGPTTATQARRLAADGLLRRLVCDPLTGILLDHGRTRYRPPDHLAVCEARDANCAMPGCRQAAHHCDIDHTAPFSTSGPTNTNNLASYYYALALVMGAWDTPIMPKSEVPQVREFLYVDVDRTRSLLAQMAGGVVEAVKSINDNDVNAEAKASIFGLGGSAGYRHGWQREESRSMQDFTFAGFEIMANDLRLIVDLSDTFRDPDSWASGQVHQALMNGQLARIRCDVQMLDGKFFSGRIERFIKLAESFVDINFKPGPVPGKGRTQGKGAQDHAREALLIEYFGDMQPSNLRAIGSLVEAFVGDEVSVRLLPCGAGHLQFGFSGTLLGRREYMQEERDSLFSRYGQSPSEWTVVFQVASIPMAPSPTAFDTAGDVVTNNRINRAATENIANQVMTVMEGVGIAGGPSWPSVSITPLGIYRNVPRPLDSK